MIRLQYLTMSDRRNNFESEYFHFLSILRTSRLYFVSEDGNACYAIVFRYVFFQKYVHSVIFEYEEKLAREVRMNMIDMIYRRMVSLNEMVDRPGVELTCLDVSHCKRFFIKMFERKTE